MQVEAAKDSAPEIAGIDTSKLSTMLEKRAHGSVVMEPERRARIEQALAELKAWQDSPVLVYFVGDLGSTGVSDGLLWYAHDYLGGSCDNRFTNA